MGVDKRALNSMSKGHCSSLFYHLIQYDLGKHNFPKPQFLIYTTNCPAKPHRAGRHENNLKVLKTVIKIVLNKLQIKEITI